MEEKNTTSQKTNQSWLQNKWNVILVSFIILLIGFIGFLFFNPLQYNNSPTPPKTFMANTSYEGVWGISGGKSKLTILRVNKNKVEIFWEFGTIENGGHRRVTGTIQPDSILTVEWMDNGSPVFRTFTILPDGNLKTTYKYQNKISNTILYWIKPTKKLF